MTCCRVMTSEMPSATVRESLGPPVAATRPALDVVETTEEFRLHVDVPGSGKEDVEVGFENGLLTLKARIPTREEASGRYHVREHARREFVRKIRLADTIDADGITAEVTRGVLTVHLPKAAAAKPRRIEVH